MNEIILLEGIFTKFATKNYPGRIYDNSYIWVWNEDEIDGNWVKVN